MIEFTYTINSEPVEKALANFQASLADQSAALRDIADDFREMVGRQFSTEGRAEGTPWAARKSVGAVHEPPSTQRAIHESPLLVRTGALLRSLTGRGAEGHVEQVEEHSLAIGTSLPYAAFHQFGTRGLPARPIIVLSGARSERWVEIVRRGIEEKTQLLGEKDLRGEKV